MSVSILFVLEDGLLDGVLLPVNGILLTKTSISSELSQNVPLQGMGRKFCNYLAVGVSDLGPFSYVS